MTRPWLVSIMTKLTLTSQQKWNRPTCPNGLPWQEISKTGLSSQYVTRKRLTWLRFVRCCSLYTIVILKVEVILLHIITNTKKHSGFSNFCFEITWILLISWITQVLHGYWNLLSGIAIFHTQCIKLSVDNFIFDHLCTVHILFSLSV